MNLYGILATAVLVLHLVWITFAIGGWLFSRNRPTLRKA
jgi:hypothetical protein